MPKVWGMKSVSVGCTETDAQEKIRMPPSNTGDLPGATLISEREKSRAVPQLALTRPISPISSAAASPLLSYRQLLSGNDTAPQSPTPHSLYGNVAGCLSPSNCTSSEVSKRNSCTNSFDFDGSDWESGPALAVQPAVLQPYALKSCLIVDGKHSRRFFYYHLFVALIE